MTKKELKTYIEDGREIEFTYKKKRYSITYYNDDREKYISVCEFYKDPVDVANFDELFLIILNNKSIGEMLSSISDDEYSLYWLI